MLYLFYVNFYKTIIKKQQALVQMQNQKTNREKINA